MASLCTRRSFSFLVLYIKYLIWLCPSTSFIYSRPNYILMEIYISDGIHIKIYQAVLILVFIFPLYFLCYVRLKLNIRFLKICLTCKKIVHKIKYRLIRSHNFDFECFYVLLFALVKYSVVLGKEVQSKVDRFQIDMLIQVHVTMYH